MVNKLFFVLCSSLLILLVPLGATAQNSTHLPTQAEIDGALERLMIPKYSKLMPSTFQKSLFRHMEAQAKKDATRNADKPVQLQSNAILGVSTAAIDPSQTIKVKQKYIRSALEIKEGRVGNNCVTRTCNNKRRAAIYAKRQKWVKDTYGIEKKPQAKMKYITQDGNINTLYCNPGPCTAGSLPLFAASTGKDMGISLARVAEVFEKTASELDKKQVKNKKQVKSVPVDKISADIQQKSIKKLDKLFENPMAGLDDTNDKNLTRALSIPIEQVTKNKEAYTKLIESSHDNVNPLQLSCWWC